jgi:superfamily II DNA or RNA helicase
MAVVLDLRGRDLVLLPPEEWRALPTDLLQERLFGPYLPAPVATRLGRDRRQGFLRTLPLYFNAVKQALERQGTPFRVAFDERPALPFATVPTFTARPYQREALERWLAAGRAGVVVLPTGAGKTLVAALAIHESALWTLVVVPTIDLLRQWQRTLTTMLGLQEQQVGLFGGGSKELQPITIITYDSAALYPLELRRFGLLIFDECHHLPAPTYRQIALSAFTPWRLGLTATPERSDQAHHDLVDLIGPELYRRDPAGLSEERYLARYREIRIDVVLSPEDHARYSEQRALYLAFLKRRRIFMRSPEEFQQKLIFLSAYDKEARAALQAWRTARALALNASAKYAEIEKLLLRHAGDQVLLFSEYNQVVDEISRRFCLPSVTYRTPAEERRIILERFRAGQYSKLVTGRVLNEGVDLPDCRVAIIVSGSSTRREYIQRLGRVLRPKEGEALLYELVTSGTTEEEIARRRR